MVLCVKGFGLIGSIIPYNRYFYLVVIQAGANLRIVGVGDVSTHQEDAVQISPPGGMPTEGASAETSGGRELVLPPTGYGNSIGELGVGGYICCLPPEQRITVNCNQTHHGSVSGGKSVTWGGGVPEGVGTGEPEPVVDTGGRR